MGQKPLGLPCASAGPYRASVDDPAQYRQSLGERLRQYPALLPHEMDQGFPLHARSGSITQDLRMRRSTWHTTAAVFTLRPSCVMPSRMARTDAVDKALDLRQWGGPFETPWPLAVAAMPGAGSAPGWPAAARRWSAPPCKPRTRCPALWWPLSS